MPSSPPTKPTRRATSTSSFETGVHGRRQAGTGLGVSRKRERSCAIRSTRSFAPLPARRHAAATDRALLLARYRCTRLDAGVFQDRIKSLLPQFRAHFERAQDETGVEWRLLAAIAYQESQWDAQATSETGVRGPDAADRGDRPPSRCRRSSRSAGQRHSPRRATSRDLKDKLPAAHPGARPHLARAGGVQHRHRTPRGRAGARAEAEARSGRVVAR